MTTTTSAKYEDRLRTLDGSDDTEEWEILSGLLQPALVADALEAARLVLADITELGAERVGELRLRGGPITDLHRALEALDQAAGKAL